MITESKARVEDLQKQIDHERDPVKRKILLSRMNAARSHYYDFLPIPERDGVPTTGKKVTVAVMDGGILQETAHLLRDQIEDYLEMDWEFRITRRTAFNLYPMLFFDRAGDQVIKRLVNHGDNMLRLVHQVAPDAHFLIINNYNREITREENGVSFSCRLYDGPLALIAGVEYLTEKYASTRPLILSLSEGFPPYTSVSPDMVEKLQAAFQKAHESGILIAMAAGNIRLGNPQDSYRLGMNFGVACPWVIPAAGLDDQGRALKSARYDPDNRHKVLYVPAGSSSAATAKIAALGALLLEKRPELRPAEVRKLLFETATLREEANGRMVYRPDIRKALTQLVGR